MGTGADRCSSLLEGLISRMLKLGWTQEFLRGLDHRSVTPNVQEMCVLLLV
jgi:hypothetical protein